MFGKIIFGNHFNRIVFNKIRIGHFKMFYVVFTIRENEKIDAIRLFFLFENQNEISCLEI